ncbi:MAG TPA: MarR family winged helix-turn-helix transcriptional regulator [Phenylobacterium sp.]|uniref:MarR family winged helix-turn-helix transcriptional regulator n=1 Tax=Phenylobacterium sp. TaxID=1871053 RepID=UPI002B48F4E0|nr:MarR family winged helix-turn-helix transcriptional regulator [Phenylobacterium sp.]HKR89667.1 MarR family winged helix-turn-helix transcriptional regulator [Phenylobacterium sp.]HKT54921.1 MarR family winged helix-turn-helix transcriptional regulator [Caulobacteraceae bacterium]
MPRKSSETGPPEPPFRQLGLTEEIVSQWRGQTPGSDHLAHAIGVAVTRLCILNEHFVWRTCKELDVTAGGLRLLYALRRVGPPYAQRPTDLYRLLGVTSGAVSYTINLLKKRGLIEPADDPRDGRSYLLKLTEAGVRLVDGAVVLSARMASQANADLTPEALRATAENLLQLAKSWEKAVDAYEAAPTTETA